MLWITSVWIRFMTTINIFLDDEKFAEIGFRYYISVSQVLDCLNYITCFQLLKIVYFRYKTVKLPKLHEPFPQKHDERHTIELEEVHGVENLSENL